MPVESADGDTSHARATGEPEIERLEFMAVRKPGRLTLDGRGRTHDYNALNNNERRPFVGRAAVALRLDDPTRETARRDALVSAWMPGLWSNDFGGLTRGLRPRSNYLGRYHPPLPLLPLSTPPPSP